MTLAIISNLVTISNCDADDWDGGIGTLDTDFKKEGQACLGLDTDIETNYAYKTIAESDWTGRHLYVWLMCLTAPTLDIKTNGGMRLVLVDSSGNEGYWYVAGSDTYSGGWRRFIISADSTPDANNGSNPIKTAITKVGVGFKCVSKSKLAQNTFWDYVQYDTAASRGVKITGGATTPRDWDEVLAKDDAATIGLIRKEAGVFYIQGTMQFGDAATDINFADTNQVLIYEDIAASSDFHKIIIIGGGDTTTNFKLGTESGGAGISGCVIKSAGNPKFQIDVADTNIDILGLYGCTFFEAGTISLPTTSTTREVLNCNIEASAEILANTCIVKNCNFISSTGRALRISSTSHNVTSCNFINCQTAVHHDVGGPEATPLEYGYNALMFTGGTYHIENSASSPNYYINIGRTNNSNPDQAKINNSNGGTTTILPLSVYLTVWVKDEANVAIEGASVAIYTSADDTELMNELSDVDGKAQETFQYTADTDIYIRIRKSSTGATRYFPASTTGTITSTGFTLTAVLIKDEVVVP